ncbi:hypothetical protein FQA39_LY13011 [Lamprigera yunnana]|nr:hypothetical protein FQA39_LY13011 [Lamprigera yunnana]
MLTSIRDVSFDIYDGETVAIVGESGSGKSVLTKTLTNMLDSNGYIADGSIIQRVIDSKNKLSVLKKEIEFNPESKTNIEKRILAEERILSDAYREMSSFNRLSRRTRNKVKPIMKVIADSSNLKKIKNAEIKNVLKYLKNEEYLTDFEVFLEQILNKILNNEEYSESDRNLLLEV